MKTHFKYLLILVVSAVAAGCEEQQIADDSACPNCPIVTKVDPVIAQEGSEVTVSGQRFGTDKSKITLEIMTEPQKTTIAPADILSVTDTEIRFKVPAGRQGIGKVVVKLDVGTEILASDDIGIASKPEDVMFAFSGKGQFTMDSIKGRVGDELLITGVNFGSEKEKVQMKIGLFDIPRENITSVTDSEIKFRIPQGVPAQDQVVVLINGFAVNGQLTFTYLLPVITTSVLKGAKDQTIAIQGNYFTTNKNDVKIYVESTQIPASQIESATDSEIRFKVSRGMRSGKLTVNISGFDALQKPDFYYQLTHTVSSYSYVKSTMENRGSVMEFRVDTSSGRDVLYLGYQELLGNAYLMRIASNNDITAPTESPINQNNLMAVISKDYVFPVLKWIVPVDDKILYHYTAISEKNNIGKEEFRIGEINKTAPSATPRFVEPATRTRAFYRATAVSGRQLYAIGYSEDKTTNPGNAVVSLTRNNVSSDRFAFTNMHISSTSTFNDVEVFDSKIYLCDAANHKIFQLQSGKNGTWTLATISGDGNSVADETPIASASYRGPTDLAFDKAGNLFVCDSQNSVIRKISQPALPGSTVSIIAGDPNATGMTDGPGRDARFNRPTFIGVGKGGRIYVYDSGNVKIRVITAE